MFLGFVITHQFLSLVWIYLSPYLLWVLSIFYSCSLFPSFFTIIFPSFALSPSSFTLRQSRNLVYAMAYFRDCCWIQVLIFLCQEYTNGFHHFSIDVLIICLMFQSSYICMYTSKCKFISICTYTCVWCTWYVCPNVHTYIYIQMICSWCILPCHVCY